MKNASKQLGDVLEYVRRVKSALRNRKYCYEECENEKIREIFLISLKAELLLLYNSLNIWINAGLPMEETETVNLNNAPEEDL